MLFDPHSGGDIHGSTHVDVPGGLPHFNRKLACLDVPVVNLGVPVGEGALVQCEGHILAFPGLESNLIKALQLPHRAEHLAVLLTYVELDNGFAEAAAGIRHGNRGGKGIPVGDLRRVQAQIRVGKGGVEVTSYVKLPDKAKTAMSIVAAADYRLSYKEGYESPFSTEEWKRIVKERFLDSPQFTIIKKTKKSEREVDLKPLVYAFSVEEEQGRPAFFLQVSTGSVDNIKPELVLSSVYQLCGLEYCESAIQIHRLEVYARDEQGQLVGLSGMGEEIV